MSRKSSNTTYYDKLLFMFKNAAAFMPFVMIPFGFLARSELVDSRFYSGDGVFASITILYSAASILNFWYAKKNPHSTALDLAFTIIFHLLTLMFILFVSGFLSAFLSVWIILMISTDLRFGTRGFLASFIGLCLAGLLTFLAHPAIPQGEKFEIIQGAVVVGAIGFVIAKIRNITDHERVSLAKTREKESYQRERLLALVNSMGDAVVATSEQGIIKVYNSTFLSLLDTNINHIGQPIDDVLALRDGEGKLAKIIPEAQLRHMIFSRTDLSRKVGETEIMRLYINVAPIQPGYHSHAERGFIFILRDITKEKTLEEQRDEFISVVSHELRTPVAIAEGSLSNIQVMMASGTDIKTLEGVVKDAHDHVVFLAQLVNDLSTLSKAERGVIGNVEMVSIPDVLADIQNSYAAEIQAKHLTFSIAVDPGLPKIFSSPIHFREILQNLMTNAIKYTKKGSIAIKVTRDAEGIRVAVSDTGIGISKSDQVHIFEKFYRSEDYRTRETGGTGLGLYVCRKLAENIGMKITFESRLNHGSTFTLTIPAEHAALKTAKAVGKLGA